MIPQLLTYWDEYRAMNPNRLVWKTNSVGEAYEDLEATYTLQGFMEYLRSKESEK